MALDDEKKKQYEGTNEDYYNSLKNESYKAMLSKEVQASVAADQARKYTQNALNAQGLGTQGIAQSTQLGIGNQYRNALFEAQNQHEQNLMGINNEQRAAYQNDMNNLYAMADETTDKDTMDLYMKRMGYMDYDGNWKQGVPDEVRAEYDNWLSNKVGTGTALSENEFNIEEAMQNKEFMAYGDDGVKRSTARLRNEFAILQGKVANGEIKDGQYVQLRTWIGTQNRNAYIYYKNGKYYFVTPAEFKNAPANAKAPIIEHK